MAINKKKTKNLLLTLIAILGLATITIAQAPTPVPILRYSECFTKHQLIKMQNSSIEDIRMFLNTKGWSFDGAKSNQSIQYFKYPLLYNIVQWGKSSYSNGDKIILYNYKSKPNIIIYQSNSICFKELLNSFTLTSNGVTKIDGEILTTMYKENAITIEFREYKNDYSNNQYSILVYNSAFLFEEIKALKTDTTKKNMIINQDGEEEEPSPIVEVTVEQKQVEQKQEEIFTLAEVMPDFPGSGFQAYLKNNVRYPFAEKDQGKQGTVYISFVVEKNGAVTNVRPAKEVADAPGFTKEAIRLISLMPKWTPGMNNGHPVRIEITQPIRFTLQ